MARLNRIVVAGHAHHVSLRAASGNRAFVESADYRLFLDALCRASVEHEVLLHAYVLLEDEVHLLATPKAAAGLSRMMQALARFYVPAFNRRHARNGALWRGRFRAAPVGGAEELLVCMLYIEQRPANAGRSSNAAEYEHSSAAQHVGKLMSRCLAGVPADSSYWQLGNTPFDRDAAYLARLLHPLNASQVATIETTTLLDWPLGSTAFLMELQRTTTRRLTPLAKGRLRSVPN